VRQTEAFNQTDSNLGSQAPEIIRKMSFEPEASDIAKARDELQLKGTLKEMFETKVFRRNLILMMVIWSFCSFSFFLIPYYLDTIPGNLFLMSSATAVAEILSSLICLFITHNIEIRKSIAFFCLVSCSATIAIILLTLLLKSNS